MHSKTKQVKHVRHRERRKEEEEEAKQKARYLEKLKAKSELVRAEFEKHKKEIMLSGSDISKTNEAKLKSQLNELMVNNKKKEQTLARLHEFESRACKENGETANFAETLSKFETQMPLENVHFSMEYQSNRLPSYLAYNEDKAKVLGEKLVALKDALSNIERLDGQEDEMEAAVQTKLKELTVDHGLLTRKVLEVTASNNHFDKRFAHLKEIEFIANSKYGEAQYRLNEIKDLTKDLKNKERTFMKEKSKNKTHEGASMQEKHHNLSTILLTIDEKKLEYSNLNEELQKIDLKHEQLIERKKNTKVVAEYAALIEHLYNLSFDPQLDMVSEVLHDMLEEKEREKREKEKLIIRLEDSPPSPQLPERRLRKGSYASVSRESRMSMRDSLEDRDYYLSQIHKFYDKFPDGPDSLVAKLAEVYEENCFKERSLNKMYQETEKEKIEKENKLQALNEELERLKDGSISVDHNNALEAPDAGIITIDSETITLKQAKYIFESQKEADSDASLIATYEIFVMRCYLDSIEMIARLGKLLVSTANHSDFNVPTKLRSIGKDIVQQISLFKKPKKTITEVVTPRAHDQNQLSRTLSVTSIPTEDDQLVSSDLNDAFQTFIAKFGDYPKKATEFVDRLRHDTMISSFIKVEDVQAYLNQFNGNLNVEEESRFYLLNKYKNDVIVERVFLEIIELRTQATENMIKRFQLAFTYYTKLITLLQICKDDCANNIGEDRSPSTVPIDMTESKIETSEQVKDALRKKQDAVIGKYGEYSKRENQLRKAEVQAEQKTKEKENLDEDFHSRLHEVTKFTLNKSGVRSYGDGTAFLSKTKKEEEQRRLMIKAKKEKIRQAFMRMNEDEYLDWKRKQLKEGDDLLLLQQHEEGGDSKKQETFYGHKLTHSVQVQELKKMIQSSRILSKINILERYKSEPDGFKQLKYEQLGNYIPHNPIVVKSTTTSPKAKDKFSLPRSIATPSNRSTQSHQSRGITFIPYAASTRNSPVNGPLDSTQDLLLYRSNSQVMATPVSKFRQRAINQSHSEMKLDIGGSRRRLAPDSFGLDPASSKSRQPTHFRSQSQKAESEAYSTPKSNSLSKQKIKLNNLLNQNGGKEQENRSTKVKYVSALPALNNKKKRTKKIKQKRSSLPNSLSDANDLYLQLNMRSDPLLQGVCPMSFLSTNFPISPTLHPFNFKFDSNNNRNPLLVFPEKRQDQL